MVLAAAREHEQFIAGEVLARQVHYAALPEGFAGIVGDGVEVRVAATRLVSV
jgi:isoleucyl-tRNA synthetase